MNSGRITSSIDPRCALNSLHQSKVWKRFHCSRADRHKWKRVPPLARPINDSGKSATILARSASLLRRKASGESSVRRYDKAYDADERRWGRAAVLRRSARWAELDTRHDLPFLMPFFALAQPVSAWCPTAHQARAAAPRFMRLPLTEFLGRPGLIWFASMASSFP